MWLSLRFLTLLAALAIAGCESASRRSALSRLPQIVARPSECSLQEGPAAHPQTADIQPLDSETTEQPAESTQNPAKARDAKAKSPTGYAGWKPTSSIRHSSRKSATTTQKTPQSAIMKASHSQADSVLKLPPLSDEGNSNSLLDTDESEGSGKENLQLADVISSVLTTYPMVQAAALQFQLAEGKVLSAEGAFDTRLKGATENGPLGFYETYRHSLGALQPLANGGEVFGGYRVGRGVFQPWYQERQTNEGGEFKAGLSVPLSRNVGIDNRRAGVRKAGLELAAADPQFRGEVIFTIQAASESYWQWVAAAAQQSIAERVLDLATTRNDGLEEEVRAGAKASPVLKDNRRSILSREAKLIDTQRKFAQTAAKLSIFLRTTNGEPRVATEEEVPDFPSPVAPEKNWQHSLARQAIQSRPELRELDLAIERIDVEISEASNDLLPNVTAVLIGSQDMGEPTSKKRDKSEFELEAALLVDVPLQRRKARGKLTSLEAKRAQLAQKRRLSEDKIRTDIAVAFAAVKAAYKRVQRTAEARDLAEFMADVEREKFDAGESDLLKVALREEKAAESAGKAIDAQLEYQLGLAQLRAATGIDNGSTVEWALQSAAAFPE